MKCPKAIRKAVWLKYIGEQWKAKCTVSWCKNYITILGSWHVGHDIPKSKGGTLDLYNLRPICSDCNSGMGNRLTIKEWDNFFIKKGLNTDELYVAFILDGMKDEK